MKSGSLESLAILSALETVCATFGGVSVCRLILQVAELLRRLDYAHYSEREAYKDFGSNLSFAQRRTKKLFLYVMQVVLLLSLMVCT